LGKKGRRWHNENHSLILRALSGLQSPSLGRLDDADSSASALLCSSDSGGFAVRRSSRQFNRLISGDKPVVPTDDGGSGLLEACKARFAPPLFEVECDARHTVWVKRTDGTRSFGMPPWLLRQYSLSDVLERAEEKLGAPAPKA
jgi:hypothetical protein